MSQALNFPARIYQILEHESSDIIQWNSNGLSFRIVDHIRFEAEIIPKYFRHRKISSVQRQLNVYGFRSISRGEHKRSFYHPLFKRGNWDVVKNMARYVPPKGGVTDVDPEHIESAIPCAAPVKVERDIENCAPTPMEAHWGSTTPSAFTRKVFSPSYAPPAAPSSIYIRGGGMMMADAVPAQPPFSFGTVQINMQNDAADNHFSNDFFECSAVGTEANHITIQPVDYSIPMLFPSSRAPAPAVVTAGTSAASHQCSHQCGSQGAPSSTSAGHCRSSVQDCRSSQANNLYNATFHLVNICPKDRANSKNSMTVDVGNQVSDATAAAWSDLIFDPEGECFDQLLDNLDGGFNLCTYSASIPLRVDTDKPTATDCNYGCGPQFERFRSDSLDDVYALCADLY